jgi:cyclohexanecarboxylate-CoA ligase
LVRDAPTRIGCKVISVWGMTEVLLVTTVRPEDPVEKACETDGIALPNYAVRVVDETGRDLPHGTSGRLLTQGASQCVGYFKRPALYTIDPNGWLLIIRGGENIPVVEIENLLLEHPAVNAVAIVAMPDARCPMPVSASAPAPTRNSVLGSPDVSGDARLSAGQANLAFLPA